MFSALILPQTAFAPTLPGAVQCLGATDEHTKPQPLAPEAVKYICGSGAAFVTPEWNL